ncbi:MAG: CvpA family protein [Anaerolineae bacterium]|nr:CvpA family protein [Anaerolineae bacterium]MCO5188421.1 CvpA family protein [Anaerolineae bacterium]MCO5192926.1 CvpA family protein [Anaerolineae bacterium]MCO5198450.1 CvpA family protein [Anaerolineae bacterium]MCO5205902.1 CvpA family protein [Anaerolineae bacterium]
MIMLWATLVIMMGFFAIIGSSRGWGREVVASAGLILAIFAIDQGGAWALGWINAVPPADVPLESVPIPELERIQRIQIIALTSFMLIMAAFSFQGPTLTNVVAARLRIREGFQERILGFFVGAINGYLLVGSIISFNEWILGSIGWERLPVNRMYIMEPIVTRPIAGGVDWMNYLPPQFMAPFLLPLLIIVFLFVIIVLI